MITGEILSASAGILIFCSTFPQVRQTLKTRLTRDLSLMNLIFCVSGLTVWTTYAMVTWQPIFAIGDGIDTAMWGTVLVIKVKNVKNKQDSLNWKESIYEFRAMAIVLTVKIMNVINKREKIEK